MPAPTTEVMTRPQGPNEVVVRVGCYGVTIPDSYMFGPTFTLYGDGTMILGSPLGYRIGNVEPVQVDELIREAERLGMFSQPFDYTNPGTQIIDGPLPEVLVLNANGETTIRTVSGTLDFPEAANFASYLAILARLADDVPTKPWEPQQYIALRQEPGPWIFYLTAEPVRSFGWAVLPDAIGVTADTLSERWCSR